MKYIFTLIAICFTTAISFGQVTKIDTTEVEKPLVGVDTVAKIPIELEEVYVSNRYDIKSVDKV